MLFIKFTAPTIIHHFQFSACSTSMETPLISFSNPDNPTSNLFLGLEWSNLVPPLSFSTPTLDTQMCTEHMEHNLGESMLVQERLRMEDNVAHSALQDGLNGQIEGMDMMGNGQNDIEIDSDLLTLRSRCLDERDGNN